MTAPIISYLACSKLVYLSAAIVTGFYRPIPDLSLSTSYCGVNDIFDSKASLIVTYGERYHQNKQRGEKRCHFKFPLTGKNPVVIFVTVVSV